MITAKLVACVAALTGLPAVPPPPVVVTTAEFFRVVRSDADRPDALYAEGVIYLRPGAPLSLVAHEVTHRLQDAAGLPTNTPAAERQAYFVQRHADAWCGK